MQPLISIVVPIYNAEKKLRRCIDSICGQTYQNIEVILVNDGSTDNSLKICEEYMQLDSRVKIINKRNGGVSSARNAALDEARGEFIGFVDSDDYIDKNMYFELVSNIDEESDLIVLSSNTINKNKLIKNDVHSVLAYEAMRFIFKLQFPTSLWAYMYRRETIGELRLNENVHFFEDFEFNTSILLKSKKVSLLNDDLYHYEINEESINSQKISDKKLTCLNIYSEIMKDPTINNDLVLSKKAECFRAHFLVSIILSLAKSLDSAEEKYFVIAKENAIEIVKKTIQSREVKFKHKIIILFAAISIRFTTKVICLLKSIKN